MLGKRYEIYDKHENEEDHHFNPFEEIETDYRKIIWFSYRNNFPQLLHDQEVTIGGSHVSDTGWGCMIRACQMAFAECLKRRIRNREGLRQGIDE